MKPYNFLWDGSDWDADGTIEAVQAIQEIRQQQPPFGEFQLLNPPFSDLLLRALLDAFRHCYEQEIVWDTFVLRIIDPEDDGNNRGNAKFHFVRPLLCAIHTMSLVRRLELHVDATVTPIQQNCEFLLAGCTLNRRLEGLQIYSTSDGGRITMGDYQALGELLRTAPRLRQLTLDGVTNLEETLLCGGLQENKTLQGLNLSFIQCDVPDASLANIVSSLAHNPELQSLVLLSSGQFGPLASLALQDLLVNCSALKTLAIKGYEFFEFDTSEGKLDADALLQGISQCKSLRAVLVADALETDQLFAKFFCLLRTATTSIQKLHLWEFDIAEQDFETVTKNPNRLSRPVVLGLGFSVMKRLTNSIVRLLAAHPELRLEHSGAVIGDNEDRDQQNLERLFLHSCEMNWYGRYLLDRPKFPLSMWPVVLEKANAKPSVIFDFLKGPAFVARQPYHQ
eukprot:scaffold1727_cov133-Cylindrotheca_fusiformis.AAC.42